MDKPVPHRQGLAASARYARWAATLFVVAMLTMLLQDLYYTRQESREHARLRAGELGELLAQRTAGRLAESERLLQGLHDSVALQPMQQDGQPTRAESVRLSRYLAARLQGLPFIEHLEILNLDCRPIAASSHSADMPPRTDVCRWLHRAATGQAPFTAVSQGPQGPELVQAIRVHTASGETIGLALSHIRRVALQNDLDRNLPGAHGETLLLDQSQTILAAWPRRAIELRRLEGVMRPAQVFERHDNTLLFVGPSLIDGRERFYSVQPVGNYPLVLITGIDANDLARDLPLRAVSYFMGWLLICVLTWLALRAHLANLRQTEQLLESARRIREGEERARLALDTAPVALLLVSNQNGRILYANTPARTMLHLPGRDGARDSQVMDLPFVLPPVDAWVRTGEMVRDREVEIVREDQSTLWVMVSLQPALHHEQPATLVGLFDLSQRKALENELEEKNRLLEEMAITDPLTRLYNRRHADQVLRDEIVRCERYGQQLTVAVFDIDHFKRFNDRYGHQAGDNVLLLVGNEIRDATRQSDIGARIGGEEFLIIFPCTRLRDAYTVMERIRQRLAETVLPFTERRVTFSGGLTDWHPGDTPSSMLMRADKLLYEAKVSGRDGLLLSQEEA